MKKYLITGSDGLVGSALKKILGDNHVYHTRKDAELTDRKQTLDYINYQVKHNGVDTIINCAAKVGGVQAKMKYQTLLIFCQRVFFQTKTLHTH
jgi:dTDP-4-dehydrorhamnose reductase